MPKRNRSLKTSVNRTDESSPELFNSRIYEKPWQSHPDSVDVSGADSTELSHNSDKLDEPRREHYRGFDAVLATNKWGEIQVEIEEPANGNPRWKICTNTNSLSLRKAIAFFPSNVDLVLESEAPPVTEFQANELVSDVQSDQLTERTEEEYKGWSAVLLPEDSGIEVIVYNPTPRYAGQISVEGFSIQEAITAFHKEVDQVLGEEAACPWSIGQKVRLLGGKCKDEIFKKWGSKWQTIESVSPLILRRARNSSEARAFEVDQLTDHDFACDCAICWPGSKRRNDLLPPPGGEEVSELVPDPEIDSPTSPGDEEIRESARDHPAPELNLLVPKLSLQERQLIDSAPDLAPLILWLADQEEVTESTADFQDDSVTAKRKYDPRGTARTANRYYRYSCKVLGKVKHCHIPGRPVGTAVADARWRQVQKAKKDGWPSEQIVQLIDSWR